MAAKRTSSKTVPPPIPEGTAKPTRRAKSATPRDPHAKTRKLLQRLTPKALNVLDRQMDSEDEKTAHNAASKILALQESMDAWQSKESVTVIFQGIVQPGLPASAETDSAPGKEA